MPVADIRTARTQRTADRTLDVEAWGFQMAPNLKASFEGSGNVKVDAQSNVITSA
jgi:hypothetical protein